MKILISNDDGFDSPGIQLLAKAAEELGEVYVVAPHRERSTAGHSLTLHKPLRIIEHGPRRFSTSGTPADCIYLGIHYLLKEKPDLILSGINRGANLGTDVFYSGTVAAAREGALMNIKSYAFSMVSMHALGMAEQVSFDFGMAARIAKEVLVKTLNVPFPSHTLLNVNIPNIKPEEVRGIQIARQGFRHYQAEVTQGIDPRGKKYFWVGGPYRGFEKSQESDCQSVQEKYVSVTPLTIDCTHNEFYATLSSLLNPGEH
ncbi:MAG: 5'/3'-nucleotidase SurE [Pseudomonadota bacterium]